MNKLSGKLRLRPTRIGFLLRPSDMRSLRRIMRLCASLWGGEFNPIIPVCRAMPKVWRRDNHSGTAGMALSRGYIRFFEPDVYVEAEQGLAEKCGITEEFGSPIFNRVITLEDFVTYKDGHPPEFAFGLNIIDIYEELYSKEYRFEPRHQRQVVLFEGSNSDACFIEAVSGAFPEDEGLSFIRDGYLEAFGPEVRKASAESWSSALQQSARDPLTFTSYGFKRQPDASWNLRLFITDPRSSHDLIDLWNLRQFCDQVMPVNVEWLDELRGFLRDIIKRTYRPLPGNPHSVMIHTTIEFGRSISADRTEEICRMIFDDLPPGSWKRKAWYSRVWEFHSEDGIPKLERAVIEAKSGSVELAYEPGERLTASFPALSPSFAQRYGAHRARWINVLSLTDFAENSALALVLPSTRSRLFGPCLIGPEAFLVSREGIVLPQQYRDTTQFFRLPTGQGAIREWLRQKGITATPSEPGRVADQILRTTDGFRGAYLLCHAETLQVLDKMSKSVRMYDGGQSTAEYPDRTAHMSKWLDLIKRRKKQNFEPALDMQAFVDAKALRLGLAIECSKCKFRNWYGLGHITERLRCERCLQDYKFPQESLNPSKTPWHYRVTGPFSVPDYAHGAYSTVLALRFFAMGPEGLSDSITYSSNLDLEFDGNRHEIDFACWYARKPAIGLCEEPMLVVGEAKSFSKEAINQSDIDRLKAVAEKLPATTLAIAVLKDALSDHEKKLVGSLALWGRKQMGDGRWRAPVLVLTATELFARHNARNEWRKAGGLRERLTQPAHVQMDNLITLANLTQQVYLDLPDYFTWLKDPKPI